ncbi:hypothetical protein FA13DRAFT_1715768 [Coprinellus micaceus]|uniref:Uncharacterized protein n=1 Tax=Coprinellus micaceus TaxID=71717 RepID=A0A4Y7SM57_COPMI|nr:hypothetical protein FA13DRAFT_1715768 [Coprinellus micaceus]
MATQERIGDTTSKLYKCISEALHCYLQTYGGGVPSKHDPAIHSSKFANEAIEEIVCSSVNLSAFPMEKVKESLENVDDVLISSLKRDQLPFLLRFERDVEGLMDKAKIDIADLKASKLKAVAEGKMYQPVASAESEQAELLRAIIRPLRALVLLMQALTFPEDKRGALNVDELGREPIPIGAPNQGDLIYKTNKTNTSPQFAIEIKVEEAVDLRNRRAKWLRLVYEYLILKRIFSERPEHQSMFGFNPTTLLYSTKPESDRQATKSKHTPSVSNPSRPVSDNSLYKISMQTMGYAYDCSSKASLLTNAVYNHILFLYALSEGTHYFYLLDLSTSRPPTPADIEKVIHFYVYISDQYMLPQQLFPPPTLPPPQQVKAAVQAPLLTTKGRLWLRVPFWVLPNFSLFSAVIGYFKTIFMLPLLLLWLRTVQPTFTMHSVRRQPVMRYNILRPLVLQEWMQIGLVFKERSRQAAILAHPSNLFVVKVFAEAILGTGTTVGGNHFSLLSNVGEALSDEISDDDAQVIWDTVLKEVHARNVHHHDLVHHNITRDIRESGPACDPEIQDCADRAWLKCHNAKVRLSTPGMAWCKVGQDHPLVIGRE